MTRIDRRRFLSASATAGFGLGTHLSALASLASPAIDRQKVVRRHNPRFSSFNPFHTLSVGNGEFAFNADITGLQTFPDECAKDFPLCTAAHWAWHTSPRPADLLGQQLKLHSYNAHGRSVGYPTSRTGQEKLFDYLRTNAHKFHLGRVCFEFSPAGGPAIKPSDLRDVHQALDLWTGTLESSFSYDGQPVRVATCVHPSLDMLAVRIESPLFASGQLRVRLAFPYGSPERTMADWTQLAAHHTAITQQRPNHVQLQRSMDDVRYTVSLDYSDNAGFQQTAAHDFALIGHSDSLEFTCHFSPAAPTTPSPTFSATAAASAAHWQRFWSDGGFVSLEGSTDARAEELERRTVLSLYNTALHCAGSLPPAETGLLCNSWYGQFHLEMHWWHGVHFASWNRFPMLERSLAYYFSILPTAREWAQTQGYRGARWPKMTDRSGRDSPSPVGPLLIWQQPHPIYYAELAYQARLNRHTLEQWRDIVFATADFMADYAVQDASGRFVLGPPLKTVSENTDPLHAHNPAFELAYWRFGLHTAQLWRKRLGMPPDARWATVNSKLAELPLWNGLYLLEEGMTDTYTKWNWEHPAHLGALGMQPGFGVDPAAMRATLRRTMDVWKWDTSWGWDFPMAAMCAARSGEPELAVQALLIESPKNHYHPNGHLYQRPDLTSYLPGNGGLLSAIGMMAAGWQGGHEGNAPGFPADGSWSVRAEGLRTWM